MSENLKALETDVIAMMKDASRSIKEAQAKIDGILGAGLIHDWELNGVGVSVNNLTDQLDSVTSILLEKSDGRPRPFSIFDEYGFSLKYIENEDQRLREEFKLKTFGETGWIGSKYPNSCAATLGGYEFSYESLLRLQAWIASVLEWHTLQGNIKSSLPTKLESAL